MPEYLAPGVYVEEVSFSAPTIEGVSTTTTGFVGPTLTGPVGGMPYGGFPTTPFPPVASTSGSLPPQLLTSFGDYQAIYGGYDNLVLGGSQVTNYMAMAVKAFFDNGGSMLYVSRVFANNAVAPVAPATTNTVDPGIATASTSVIAVNGGITVTGVNSGVVINARFPGATINGDQVAITVTPSKITNFANLANLPAGSLLAVPASAAATAPTFYANGTAAAFSSVGGAPAVVTAGNFPTNLYLITVTVTAPGASGQTMSYTGLGLDPNSPNYIGTVMGQMPPRPIDQLQNQVSISIPSSLAAPGALFSALFQTAWSGATTPAAPSAVFTLANGNDGGVPVAQNYNNALTYFEPLEDIAIVAAPGNSAYADRADILNSLIIHVSRERAYRVAILEANANLLDSDYENVRAAIDSSYAALYVPWIQTANPLAVSGTAIPTQILVPPSGFMAGIYARSDIEHSVAKAPANEVVLGAVDLERHISFAEQAVLNPLGINCIRFFPNRGYRVWGARTVSSDTTLMYINVRRYLVYLEHSIDNGTQWAVFENNGPSLWARVKDSIDSFLNAEFASGNLLGTSPSDAYFVRCDRTTMTQNDLDNGRMICLIGVALLKPAEFVIFRIGQMTANARS